MNIGKPGNLSGAGQQKSFGTTERAWFDGLIQWRGAQSIPAFVLAVSLAVSAQIWQKQQEMVQGNIEAQVKNELDDVTHALESGMGCTFEKQMSSGGIFTKSDNVGEFITSHVPANVFDQIHVRVLDGNRPLFDSQPGGEYTNNSVIQIQKTVSIGKHTLIFLASPTYSLIAQYGGGNTLQQVVYSGFPMSLAFPIGLSVFIQIRRKSLQRVEQICAMSEDIARIAFIDELTGLPNRRYIQDILSDMMRQAQSQGTELGLMVMDIVGFKMINDSLGQDVGDELLRQVTYRIQEIFQGYENLIIGRPGGDEFICFLPSPGVSDILQNLIRQFILSLEREAFFVGQHRIFVHMSVGTSVYTGNSDEQTLSDTLIAQANLAMHTAKELGGNVHCVFSQEMEERVQRRQWIDEHLRYAIEKGEIKIVYQPIVDSDSRKIISMEVLSRWNHEGKNISPDEFISVAESNGCIVPMGYQVIQDTCKQIIEWKEQGIAVPKVFINLSVCQLQDPSFEQTFREILGGFGVSSQDIGLEVTESMIAQESVKKVIGSLAEKGFEIAIDDFGTGYSNLRSLSGMRIGKIKIDKSFVKSRDEMVIGLIVYFAQKVDARIVVEGVEEQEQANWLQGLGCHSMQGFLFSRPQPPEQIQELLKKNHQ